jgi:hypothetical protein
MAACVPLEQHLSTTSRAQLSQRPHCGHAEFELNLVERHARMCVACDFAVRNPAANTNNHGLKQMWLAVKRWE